MKKLVPKKESLLFVVGETYETKFATKERFTLTRDAYVRKDGIIIWTNKTVWGVYERSPHLGECPLNLDRIVPHTKTIQIELDFCDTCGNACEVCKENKLT